MGLDSLIYKVIFITRNIFLIIRNERENASRDIVYSDQLFGAALCIHFISNHDNRKHSNRQCREEANYHGRLLS